VRLETMVRSMSRIGISHGEAFELCAEFLELDTSNESFESDVVVAFNELLLAVLKDGNREEIDLMLELERSIRKHIWLRTMRIKSAYGSESIIRESIKYYTMRFAVLHSVTTVRQG